MQGNNEAVGAVSNVLLKTLSPDRAQVCNRQSRAEQSSNCLFYVVGCKVCWLDV